MKRERLTYWLDRIMSRKCWRIVCRSGYVSYWTYRGVAVSLARDWTAMGDPSHVEYLHHPFRSKRKHVDERLAPTVGERPALKTYLRLGKESAFGTPVSRVVTFKNRGVFKKALKDEDRRAVEFLIESTKEPPK